MMNREFVAERARNLATKLLHDEAGDDARRVNRAPAADEIDTGRSYVAQLKQRFPDKTDDLNAWMSLCRVLMASNDFIYLD